MSPGTRLAAVALIALMAVGSVLLWLGIPYAWIWGASQVADSSQPSMGPYLMVLFGIPISMVIVGKALSVLNRTYGRITGTTPQVKVRLPWLQSMRGERQPVRTRTVLDVVMVASVAVAVVCMGIWFVFFAEGGGLPG